MSDFVYPFNFVPAGGPRRGANADGIGEDKKYQALDTFAGWSGRIEFRLTPLSPLFVPDPELTSYYPRGTKQGSSQFHRVMDFFNVDGQLALPGTTTKGAIRSVAEAASNSSFGVFEAAPDERPPLFRKTTNWSDDLRDLERRGWGRWEGDWESGSIRPVRVEARVSRQHVDDALALTGGTEGQRADTYAQLRDNYLSIVWQAKEVWQLHPGAPHARVLTGVWKGTDVTTAAMFPTPSAAIAGGTLSRRGPKARMDWTLGTGPQHANGPIIAPLLNRTGLAGPGPWSGLEFRYLDLDNFKTGGTEHRLCFVRNPASGKFWTARQTSPRTGFLWPHANWEHIATLSRSDPGAAAREAASVHYVPLLRVTSDQPLAVSQEVRKSFDRANGRDRRPKDGDIVRYYADGAGHVVEFGPVAMFKTAERATAADIAVRCSPELKPRTSNKALCPATRLFGWTPESGKRAEDRDDRQPVAGRVSVGFARSNATVDDTRLRPLQILSSPKPGFYPFYLRPANSHANGVGYYSTELPDTPWWPVPGQLRGRKFYLHHPDAVLGQGGTAGDVYTAVENVSLQRTQVEDTADLHSSQNATVAVLPPDSQYYFDGVIEFDSLSEYELGLLLWAVSLSDSPLTPDHDLAHKLGMGKPIGMGSTRFAIRRVVRVDPVEGWRPAGQPAAAVPGELPPGEQEVAPPELDRIVRVFKAWMMTGMEVDNPDEVARFEAQQFVKELRAALHLALAGSTPVQYYPDKLHTAQGLTQLRAYEGFKFFVQERGKRSDRGEQPLCTPLELLGDHGAPKRQRG